MLIYLRMISIASKIPPIDFAFAYGSMIIPQKIDAKQSNDESNSSNISGKSSSSDSSKGSTMIDLVFAVDDLNAFHSENIKINPHHYSGLMKALESAVGIHAVSAINNYGPGVYYNTDVPLSISFASHLPPTIERVKYGIIDKRVLISDLENWDSLYISGRLQKPVKFLSTTAQIQSINSSISNALDHNLHYAFNVGLLLLDVDNQPNRLLKKEDIYASISKISYLGDSRMGIAENPNKIRNIVHGKGNLERFTKLYSKYISEYLDQVDSDMYKVKPSNQYRIPKSFDRSVDMTNKKGRNNQLVQAISKKNFQSSLKQTMKGVITIGVMKSIKYAISKVTKRFR